MVPCGSALLGYSAAGHCLGTLRVETAGILCGQALHGGQGQHRLFLLGVRP